MTTTWAKLVLQTVPPELRQRRVRAVEGSAASEPAAAQPMSVAEALAALAPHGRSLGRVVLRLDEGDALVVDGNGFLLAELGSAATAAAVPDVRAAKDFALVKHEGQKYGDHPYSYHLTAVQSVLQRFDFVDPTILAAAWLHDAMEDQNVSYTEIARLCGPQVASVVWAVTGPDDAETRKEKFEQVYRKIQNAPLAKAVKLADRIANVDACRASGSKKLAMYEMEHDAFRRALRVEGELDAMWEHLERLLEAL